MSAVPARHAGRGRILRGIFRLVLLIASGFSVGLLVGVLAEEPTLLAGHLQGRGERVALPVADPDTESPIDIASAAPDALPAVAAPAPVAEEPAVSPGPPIRKAGHHAAAAAASEAESTRSWAIQVGAFSDESAARRLAEGLEEKGYPTALLPSEGKGGRWRVRVQPIGSEAKVEEWTDRLKRVERLPTWVISMEGRSER
ncbi:MAG TPA: SPOR domain-containing protein [Deltaproteobacteria bacterium]|nr:SPOR domain-containing protein [Deltaproteobacteria bacterium]